MLHAMIMAGGGGTRFWPKSRVALPKQFLCFRGEQSLLQSTVERIEAAIAPEHTWVITSQLHAALTAQQLPALPPTNIVGEPMGRDTTACIGLGAALIQRTDPDATIVVMPADHQIEPVREFQRAVQAAANLADEHPQALFTFGIKPSFPSTGYGYIHRGAAMPASGGIPVYQVQRFREKPPLEQAQQYIASGEFYWNSGIFIWKANTILAQLQARKPAIYDAVQRIADAWHTDSIDEVFAREYLNCEKVSIDFSVMEHAPEVVVLEAPYTWDDVGSWLALERCNPQDANGNTVQANHLGINTHNCVVVGDAENLIATIGIHDLLIIQSGNAFLVAHRNDEGKVKEVVETLKTRQDGTTYL
ncbi:MAG: mannose-1-phosphate guanylyltransferase [Zavarzinella sp.]